MAVVALLLARLTVTAFGESGFPGMPWGHFLFLVVIIFFIAWAVDWWYLNQRSLLSGASPWLDRMYFLKESAVVSAVLITMVFFFRISGISRWMVLAFFLWLSLLLLLTMWRRPLALHGGASRERHVNVLVIGSKKRAEEVLELMAREPTGKYRVVGALEVETESVGRSLRENVKVIGLLNDMENLLRREVVDEILVAIPLRDLPEAESCFELAEKVGATVRILPDWQIHVRTYTPRIASMVLESFEGVPMMTLVTPRAGFVSLFVKEIFDSVGSLVLLTLFSPIILIGCLAVYLVDRGNPFFIQERFGLHGRRFNLYKLRTMRKDAEAMRDQLESLNESDGPVFKIKNDPRLLPYVGRLLRKAGMDELPQLINVLKGEMSLVGPRPPIPDEVARYASPQLRRLSIKPGITGLWQSTPERNEMTFDEWVALDLSYIDHWSLWLDVKILFRTLGVVFRFDGR